MSMCSNMFSQMHDFECNRIDLVRYKQKANKAGFAYYKGAWRHENETWCVLLSSCVHVGTTKRMID
jgi:hypothetical protein